MASNWNSYRREREVELEGVVEFANPGAIRRIRIPSAVAGKVIGTGGSTIKGIQAQSGAKIVVKNNTTIEIRGEPAEIKKAEKLIENLIGRPTTKMIHIGYSQIPYLIGAKGANIKSIQSTSGATIKVTQITGGGANANADARVDITGSAEKIKHAEELIAATISKIIPETVLSLTEDGCKLYLRQLDKTMKKEDVMNLYPDANPEGIPKIMIRTDKSETGVFATLIFDRNQDAKIWMNQLKGQMLGGRRINCGKH